MQKQKKTVSDVDLVGGILQFDTSMSLSFVTQSIPSSIFNLDYYWREC